MLIENPAYEDYTEIKRKYDGYCVFMTHCKGRRVEPDGGVVIAYHKRLGTLTNEVLHILDGEDDIGVYTFHTLQNISDVGLEPIEVVPQNPGDGLFMAQIE